MVRVTIEEAERILQKHRPSDREPASIEALEDFTNMGYSYYPGVISYRITLKPHESLDSYLLYVSKTDDSSRPSSEYNANDLPTIHKLLSTISEKSSIPLPQPFLDTSLQIIPHHYLLFVMPPRPSKFLPLSTVRTSGVLDAQGLARIELELGAYLGQLHAIQNDWFGLPSVNESAEPSYSWQESFVLFLETLLNEIESSSSLYKILDLPFEDIRRCLSRAIGFFLFDDVEVPSLIGFAISDDDVLVALPDESSPIPTITAILPNLSWALWGDPLLESFFIPPGPSAAVSEGYSGAGGSPPIVFPRQKTKRLWYSLFLSLLILCRQTAGPTEDSIASSKTEWAIKTAQECVKALRDAPNY